MGSGWLSHPAYLTPKATPGPTPFCPRQVVRGTSRSRGGASDFSPPVPAPSRSGAGAPPRKESGWPLRVFHLILYGPTAGLEQQSRERPATTSPLPPFPPALGMTSWWGKGGEGGGRGPRTPPFPPPFPLFPQRGGRAVQPRRGGPGAVACVWVGVFYRAIPTPGGGSSACASLCLRVPLCVSPPPLAPPSPPRSSRPVGTVPACSPLLRRRPTGPPGGRGKHGAGGGSWRRGASSAMNGRRDAGSRVRAARDAYKWRFSCEGHTKKKKKTNQHIYIKKEEGKK